MPETPTGGQPPASEPIVRRIQANGLGFSCTEWRAPLRGAHPSLLLVHATGFHARVWDRMLAHLPERHAWAIDQRGHGRSDAAPITHWSVFGHDLAAIAAELDLHGAIGIGHSMGGHALVQAAALAPGRFARLILIDPVIAAPQAYHQTPPSFPGGMHPAARRQARFASAAAMLERFASRMPYRVFDPRVLRDYCEHGLLPAADGEGCTLACDPGTEAAVYMSGRGNPGVYASVRALDIPVLIVRAKLPAPDRDPFDYSFSPTWPGLVGEFRQGREIHLADRTHFVPMEAPELVAGIVRDELALMGACAPAPAPGG
jgi:pimeloyl-ACP methyl ester carboxylesterase